MPHSLPRRQIPPEMEQHCPFILLESSISWRCLRCLQCLYIPYSEKTKTKTIVHIQRIYCRSLIKVKFPIDQFRPALGSGCFLMDGLLTMLKKPQNCPISDFFDLTPKYFLVFLNYTDLVPPSTDPVPPSTNQYRSLLAQYNHISSSTTLH